MRRPSSAWRPALLCLPAVTLLVCFFVAPLLLLGRVSLYKGGARSGFGLGGGGFYQPGTWTLSAYTTLLGDSYFWEILGFTVYLGLLVTGLTLVLAYPLALAIRPLGRRAKALALSAVMLPKLANLLVIVYGLELLLSDSGPLNRAVLFLGLAAQPLPLLHRLPGVLIGETYLILPYAVLVLVAALDRIDPRLVPAARGLGAGPLGAFIRVTLPLSVPGLTLAATISLIWALGAFISPYLLGSPQELTLAVDVQKQTFENLNWPRGAADAMLMLVAISLCLLSYQVPARYLRRLAGPP